MRNKARTLVKVGELKVGQIAAQFGVAGGFFELAVALGLVKLAIARLVSFWRAQQQQQRRTISLPLKSRARAIDSATRLIDTSSSSPTERMMGSISLYSRSVQINSLARSWEKMNWRSGRPEPQTAKSSPLTELRTGERGRHRKRGRDYGARLARYMRCIIPGMT